MERLGLGYDQMLRIEHHDEVVARIETVTTSRTTDEWLEILARHEAAAALLSRLRLYSLISEGVFDIFSRFE
jgi:crotonobetainyl-CoA:carnitine CoA-transferase CaiB-like acyl-CoA transferase